MVGSPLLLLSLLAAPTGTTPTTTAATATADDASLATAAGAAASPAEAELQAAMLCYRELDYACAEEKLAMALLGELPRPALLEARHHDALLALAFQDETRMRRAVRNLLALDPGWDPGPDAPPRLSALLREERRPAAHPSPRRIGLAVGLSGGAVLLFGRDAEQWNDGMAGALSAGVLLGQRTRLDAVFGYSRHDALSFYLEQLELKSGMLAVHRHLLGSNPLLAAGVGCGTAYIDTQGVTGESSRWGLLGQLSLEAAAHLGFGLWLQAQVQPTLLVVDDRGSKATSSLLSLGLGLSWQPGTDGTP
ncbi:MAG: hypothetical protein FJ125_03645 [Deltaproteobacteria bacterium]|nr:hypothetical protein [Deltaproteobacteria bacterium]